MHNRKSQSVHVFHIQNYWLELGILWYLLVWVQFKQLQ